MRRSSTIGRDHSLITQITVLARRLVLPKALASLGLDPLRACQQQASEARPQAVAQSLVSRAPRPAQAPRAWKPAEDLKPLVKILLAAL